MGQVATIGLDIAKSVFQVHGVDAEGGVVIRQKLTPARLLKFFEKLSPCLVGIEACGTAHHWARELSGWAGSPSRATDICDRCSSSAPWRSCAMP